MTADCIRHSVLDTYCEILLLLLLLTKKFNVAFSPEELQGHGTHVNRRRVQYSTVLVEGRNCAISMTWQTSTSSNAS